MRILLLTQIVPYPLDSGPKIKTYHVLRYLSQHHEVHLVSFVRSTGELAHAESLRRFCQSVTAVPLRRSRIRDAAYLMRGLVVGRPFLIERDDSAAMRRAIRELMGQHAFDAVHADQLSMAQFAEHLPLPLRVLDEHNAVWAIVRRAAEHAGVGAGRLLAELEWRRLRAYEGDVCRSFDRVVVVSEQDRAVLESAAGERISARVIPIAVDTKEWAFAPRLPEARHVVSVATMFYPPNAEGIRWFARDVFPLVRQALPGVTFYAVGSRPPRSMTRLASRTNGVVITGYVADLAPVLRQSAVLVVPLHSGSGMRVKILEAFARGIPVVATTVGAEGIDARHGEHLLVADDPKDFARAVIQVLRDPSEASRLARAARAMIESHYDWRLALSGLDDVYAAGESTGLARALPSDDDGSIVAPRPAPDC
ncbi:MAG TPA: glycosyltransferase [Chloroflexota bacterium]|nr:glycosyltransferase [Chloroflexota bacterium]